MQKLYEEFTSLQASNEMPIRNHFCKDAFKRFTFLMITEDNLIFQAINQIVNVLKLIIIDEYEFLNKKYFIICFEQFLITINESDLGLIKEYLYQNTDSDVFILKKEMKAKFPTKMEQIGLILKDFKISYINQKLKSEISDFLCELQTQKNIQYFNIVKKCVSVYLIKQGYVNSYIDRIKNSKELFQSDSEKVYLKKGEYIALENIGFGSSSFVKMIYHIEKSIVYALKINQEDENKLFEREQKNYLTVQHPFLIKYYGIATFESQASLVLEYIEGSGLNNIQKMNLNLKEKMKIIFEIMIVIQYLHFTNFIYRDLKPNNVMINRDKTAVLIDLDRMIENISENKDDQSTRDFSSVYIAPEINEGDYSFSSDIYSIGMIIYFIIFERTPDCNQTNFPYENYNLKELFEKCINENPDKRPDILHLIYDFYMNCFSKMHDELIETNEIQSIDDKNIIQYFQYLVFLAECENPFSLYKIGRYYEKGILFPHNASKVCHYYQLSANKNYVKAQFKLGLFYYKGQYFEKNVQKAIHYFLLASEQNHAESNFYLGVIYYENKYVECDIEKSIKYFRKASGKNHIEAQFYLGNIYSEGKYIECDILRAIDYYEYCSQNGHSESQFKLGMIYYEGKHISQDIHAALKYLTLAAYNNNVNAQYNLGVIYHRGINVKPDFYTSINFLRMAAEQDHPLSIHYIGLIFYEEKFVTDAIEFFKKAAELNFLQSQFILGTIYYKGEYVKRDINQSIKYYSLAAKQNNPDAINELGAIYSEGKFIKVDINKAITYFQQASDLGYSISQYNLGIIYLYGKYVNADINKAIHFFALAAKGNHLTATFKLGYIYYIGYHIERDINKAIHYLTLAANQNHPSALNLLGIIYHDNKYVPRDINKSIYYFSLADKLNYDDAQLNLGIIYHNGEFVTRDINRAIYYFSRAAEQNNSDAQNNLGSLYLNGKFIQQDINKAIYYFNLAADLNNPLAFYNLGAIYYETKYSKHDINKAIHYLTLSSERCYSNAQCLLGQIYYDNKYIKRDINKAITYFSLASFQNNKDAQYFLGVIFSDGKYVQRNMKKAIEYLSLSAKNYNNNAALYLGCLYHQGKYIEKDIDKAIHYYKEASSFNNQFAKNNLGVIYKNNNLSLAKEYFNEAIKQKNDVLSMFNLANILLNENEINKSIDLLYKSSEKDFLPSQMLLIYILIGKLINIDSIQKEVSKFKCEEKIEAAKIMKWYEKIKIYLYLMSLSSFYDFFRSSDLLFINGSIFTSRQISEDKYEALNNKIPNINDIFYDGLGSDLLDQL
ncbi:hypothetical protein M9Y10_008056 [Tritrichomonas musculus]|uniref:Protein kinase domain-containing protein n=1 Tax=Tritrichomonas musculus TaxID=1915356 RepID=A0ABR2IY82_9EUKA